MSRVFFAVPVVLLALLLAGLAGVAFAQTPSQTAPAQTAPTQTAPAESAAVDTALADTAAADTVAAPVETEPEQPAEPTGFLASFMKSGFVDWFNKGGRFMWWLLVLSIMGVTLIIERAITLQKAKADVRSLMERVVGAIKRGKMDEALDICANTRGPIPQIIHAGLKQAEKGTVAVEKAIETAGIIEMAFLERGLIIMATVANLAPLVGFLGTVSGMIAAFEAIAKAEQVSAKLVAAGISEALITTLAGLVIAIPVQLAHNLFVQRIDRFVVEMEDSAAELVDAVASSRT